MSSNATITEPFPKIYIKFDNDYKKWSIQNIGRWGSDYVYEDDGPDYWDKDLKRKVEYDMKYNGTEWEIKNDIPSHIQEQYDEIKKNLTKTIIVKKSRKNRKTKKFRLVVRKQEDKKQKQKDYYKKMGVPTIDTDEEDNMTWLLPELQFLNND